MLWGRQQNIFHSYVVIESNLGSAPKKYNKIAKSLLFLDFKQLQVDA